MSRGICLASQFFTKHPKPHYLATGNARRIEIGVGEVVELACAPQLTYRWELTRKPPGSGAVLEGAKLQRVDKPGMYIVTVRIDGGWERVLELCAFTDAQMYGAARAEMELTRLNERSWLNQPGRSTAEVIARLER